MTRLLTLRALCRLLAVRRKVLLAWIAAEEFPAAITLPGGKLRWRADTVTAWLASLSGGELAVESLDLSSLPVLAQEMIQALAEGEADAIRGPELASRIGGDVVCDSGTWGRAVRALKQHKPPLMESDRSRGYWLTPAGRAAAVRMLGGASGTSPAE